MPESSLLNVKCPLLFVFFSRWTLEPNLNGDQPSKWPWLDLPYAPILISQQSNFFHALAPYFCRSRHLRLTKCCFRSSRRPPKPPSPRRRATCRASSSALCCEKLSLSVSPVWLKKVFTLIECRNMHKSTVPGPLTQQCYRIAWLSGIQRLSIAWPSPEPKGILCHGCIWVQSRPSVWLPTRTALLDKSWTFLLLYIVTNTWLEG